MWRCVARCDPGVLLPRTHATQAPAPTAHTEGHQALASVSAARCSSLLAPVCDGATQSGRLGGGAPTPPLRPNPAKRNAPPGRRRARCACRETTEPFALPDGVARRSTGVCASWQRAGTGCTPAPTSAAHRPQGLGLIQLSQFYMQRLLFLPTPLSALPQGRGESPLPLAHGSARLRATQQRGAPTARRP